MMNEWANAERHAEQARQLYENGLWDEALSELKLALTVNPHHSEWHFGLGLILDALKRFDEAIGSYQQALELGGQDINVMLHLAEDLLRIGNEHKALELLEQVNQVDPECEAGYCLRITCHTRLGSHDLAEQMFYLAQQVTEDCPRCFDQIAHSLASRGEMKRAIWCWKKTLRLDPSYPGVWGNLGRAFRQSGRFDQALRAFLKELRRQPSDIDALLDIAGLHYEMGRLLDARATLHRVLELDPTVAEAHLWLGQISLQEGHLESSIAELELAGRLDNNLVGVQLGLARVAIKRGDQRQARFHLKMELQRENRSSAHNLELARLFIDVGLPDQALPLLSVQARRSTDQDLDRESLHRIAKTLFYHGIALLMLGRVAKGVRQCRRSVKLEPKNTMAMQNLVVAYLDTGRVRPAAYWLNRALRIEPRQPQLKRLKYRLWGVRTSQIARRCKRWLLAMTPWK